MYMDKFSSIKEWKDYCFNTHSLYLKSPHFKKWIGKKEIYIFDSSNLKKEQVQCIKFGLQDAVRIAKLHFKIKVFEKYALKADFSTPIINSSKILKKVIKERKKSHKDNASVFIFSKPIKSQDSIIKDGEALTYVSEGAIFFTFEPSIDYPCSFLRRRAKHEALHLLGLNAHHEDTRVKGYGYGRKHSCIMEYNAPTIRLCKKCEDAIKSFWDGIRQATAKTPEKESKIVSSGYTKIAEKYQKQRNLYDNKSLLLKFTKLMPKNSRVIDLGCGAAIPVTRFLSDKGFKMTGMDFSEGMLKLARRNVPNARFIKMDIAGMKLKPNSFDGAVSFYAIIHVQRKSHSKIYRSLHKIIKNEGIILVNASGTKEWEGYSNDYFGVRMFWSSYSSKKTLAIIKNSGFIIEWSSVLEIGKEKQFWVLARNKK